MKLVFRLLLLAALAIAALCLPAAAAAAAGPEEAGSVQFARAAESDFDAYTQSPSGTRKQFMREKLWRMRTYSPYFDSRTSWYPSAWMYKNLYAIYADQELAREHPEWILKDAQGRKLYIPFQCSGGTCPQYAADFGNPAFRASWIAQVTSQARRYKGVFVDDVNMDPRVSNGNGDAVMPTDPRTGATMNATAWRRYMAEFAEQIRAALPGKEIVHNGLWFAGHDDPSVRRQLDAATHIDLERGVNDAGIKGGGGKFGFDTFLEHIDYLHSRGKGVILDSGAEGESAVEYELAAYLLISSGRDGMGTRWRSTPDDWWQGYDVKLGAPQGKRYRWKGLLRRDFARGFVLLNEPDSPARSAALGGRKRALSGGARSSVTLAGGQGAVILGAGPGTRTLVKAVPNPLTKKIARTSARTRTSRAVLVRGKVRRGRGGRASVALQRGAGGRWVTMRRATMRVSRRGAFGRVFRGLARGRYRVRASYLGTSTARPSQGRSRRFLLRH